jgi:type VI secretion system protein ImpC
VRRPRAHPIFLQPRNFRLEEGANEAIESRNSQMRERTPIVSAGVELTSSLDEESAKERAAPDPGSPFRILVMGDFTGRASRGIRRVDDLGFDRSPVRVDRDNLEELAEQLSAEVRVQLVEGGPFLPVRIRRLDDFHPDQILQQTAAFRGLLQTRLDLQDPETYARGAEEVRSWDSLAPTFAAPAAGDVPEPPAEIRVDPEALVREMLERSEERAGASGKEHFDQFLEDLIQPHLARADPPDRDALIEQTDAAIGSWMREFLHHPHFQALEAAWRGIEFLVRRIDSDGPVEVHLLDVTREELAEDLRSVSDLSRSGIHKLLVDQAAGTEGGSPWSLLAGLYTFDRSLPDVALLGRLAKLASAAGAPFLAAASPRLAGRESFEEGSPADESADPADEALWTALRGFPQCAWIGLALPRFLLRLPYGAKTDPLEEFPFEEIPEDEPSHERLLWGNPALACALLLAQCFERGGWGFREGGFRDVEGLPLYLSNAQGQPRLTPCAETLLPQSEVEAILEKGLMPLVSLKEGDVVRLSRFQSIREPLTALAGRWGVDSAR